MLDRKPAVAGLFYSAKEEDLENDINNYLKESKNNKLLKNIKGIIAPHAGFVYSGIVAGSCYSQLENLDKNKEWEFILIGPSHRYPLRGISVGAYDNYITTLGKVKVSDRAKLMAGKVGFVPQAHSQEHSLEVQLPFLQTMFNKFSIIPIIYGNVNVYQLSEFLKENINENTIFIISTDLSHYQTYEKAIETDNICNQAIPNLDIDTMIKKGDACGKIGVIASMLLAKELGWKSTFLDYKNSGDTAGTKDRVVGYGAYAFSN